MVARKFYVTVFLVLLATGWMKAQTRPDHVEKIFNKILEGGSDQLYLCTTFSDSLFKLPYEFRALKNATFIKRIDSMIAVSDGTSKGAALFMKAWLVGPTERSNGKWAVESSLAGAILADSLNNKFLSFLFAYETFQISYRIGSFRDIVDEGPKIRELRQTVHPSDIPGFASDSLVQYRNTRFIDILTLAAGNMVGSAYVRLKELDSALFQYQAAKTYAEKVGNDDWKYISWSSMGSVYEMKSMPRKALETYIPDLKQSILRKDWRASCEMTIRISQVFLSLNDVNSAAIMLDSTKLFLNYYPERREFLEAEYLRCMSNLSAAKGDYRAAYDNYDSYVKRDDYNNQRQLASSITDAENSFEFARNLDEISQLGRESAIKSEQIKLQWILFLVAASGIGLLSVVIYISRRNLRKQKRFTLTEEHQRDAIKEQNKKLAATLADVDQAQAQLVHSEKMNSLGMMTARLLSEINVPVISMRSGFAEIEKKLNWLLSLLEKYEDISPERLNERKEAISKFKGGMKTDVLALEAQAGLEAIRSNAERTAMIISRLHSFSRRSQEPHIVFLATKPIEDSIEAIAGELGDRITLIRHHMPGLYIKGSLVELVQVIVNILLNSIQAIPGNGKITIATRQFEGYVEISIRDTGRGIPEADLVRLWDPFFTTKDVGKGLGLGLPMSQVIVKSHGGDILVNKPFGGGAELIVRLPSRGPVK